MGREVSALTANQVSRRNIRLLILLSAAVYFSSYLTRLNYSAVLVEMIASEHYTRSAASAALTGLFITYGAGQLLSGYLGDRTKPQLLIFAGLLVSAAMMPVNAFTNSAYFTLRSGGKTVITFVFDCVFVWALSIPVAFILSRYTAMHILPMYIVVQALDIIKCAIGYDLLKKRKWVKNLVAD